MYVLVTLANIAVLNGAVLFIRLNYFLCHIPSKTLGTVGKNFIQCMFVSFVYNCRNHVSKTFFLLKLCWFHEFPTCPSVVYCIHEYQILQQIQVIARKKHAMLMQELISRFMNKNKKPRGKLQRTNSVHISEEYESTRC